MKQILLMMAVVALVGCSKKNPPKPEKPEALGETVKRGSAKHAAALRAAVHWRLAMGKWYNSQVVCLHCDSDLKTKGDEVCAECGREQRD